MTFCHCQSVTHKHFFSFRIWIYSQFCAKFSITTGSSKFYVAIEFYLHILSPTCRAISTQSLFVDLQNIPTYTSFKLLRKSALGLFFCGSLASFCNCLGLYPGFPPKIFLRTSGSLFLYRQIRERRTHREIF